MTDKKRNKLSLYNIVRFQPDEPDDVVKRKLVPFFIGHFL